MYEGLNSVSAAPRMFAITPLLRQPSASRFGGTRYDKRGRRLMLTSVSLVRQFICGLEVVDRQGNAENPTSYLHSRPSSK
jgi:hypothetical protein